MRTIVILSALVLTAGVALAAAPAAPEKDPFRVTDAFADTDGEALYRSSCQSCHMAEGQGVKTGAGMYPALAQNPNLQSPEYTVSVLQNGLRGMPPFIRMMTDEQIAAVTNYVITHFGNTSSTLTTAEQVKATNPEPQTGEE